MGLFWQVWSACWICRAGKYRPRCYAIHLQTVLQRLLCPCVGSDCTRCDDKPSTTRGSLIPAVSYGENKNTVLKLRFIQLKPSLWSTVSFLSWTLLQEIQKIRTTLVHNLNRVSEVINSLQGFSCQPVEGGAFAFPRLHLPSKAIRKAQVTIPSNRVKHNIKKRKKIMYHWFLLCPFLIIGTGDASRYILLSQIIRGGWFVHQSRLRLWPKKGHLPHQVHNHKDQALLHKSCFLVNKPD